MSLLVTSLVSPLVKVISIHAASVAEYLPLESVALQFHLQAEFPRQVLFAIFSQKPQHEAAEDELAVDEVGKVEANKDVGEEDHVGHDVEGDQPRIEPVAYECQLGREGDHVVR